jgi:hypothetical protein
MADGQSEAPSLIVGDRVTALTDEGVELVAAAPRGLEHRGR